MIIYGPLAGVPVTQLFLAGIIPGLMMIAAFSVVTLIWSTLDKSAAPQGQSYPLRERIKALRGVIPFLVLMAMVLGSLYAGIATPTEAGAVGVLGSILISLFRGTLSFKELMGACEEAAIATSFLLMIAVGAAVMSFAVDYLQMPQALVRFLGELNLSDIWLFVAIVILYFILGMFVEPISMVLITLPIILPVISAAGWDPLWFGIILVMLVEIGLITPPIGMILYVLAGVSEKRASLGRDRDRSLAVCPDLLGHGVFLLRLPGLRHGFGEVVRWKRRPNIYLTETTSINGLRPRLNKVGSGPARSKSY